MRIIVVVISNMSHKSVFKILKTAVIWNTLTLTKLCAFPEIDIKTLTDFATLFRLAGKIVLLHSSLIKWQVKGMEKAEYFVYYLLKSCLKWIHIKINRAKYGLEIHVEKNISKWWVDSWMKEKLFIWTYLDMHIFNYVLKI